jgi:hypothetical protein
MFSKSSLDSVLDVVAGVEGSHVSFWLEIYQLGHMRCDNKIITALQWLA